MKVTEQPSLEALTTLRVPARASLLLELESEEDVLGLPSLDPGRDLVLGGGSNILLVTDVPGSVYLNRIRGIGVVARDRDSVLVEVGAGENWHAFATTALQQGWHGLENLQGIPGLAGAAPIQNIGAYGVEIASVLESVAAWDWHRAAWVALSAAECRLSYRDSVFRSVAPDRYLITSIRLRLPLRFEPRTEYAGLAEELRAGGLSGAPTAADVSAAVLRLRRRRLPDPDTEPNAGSFFKNPVVDGKKLADLRSTDPDLPAWPLPDGSAKLPAAWLIERCGLKGCHEGGAAISSRHALVLVNTNAASGADLWHLALRVVRSVEERFGLRLEPEPRIYCAPALHDDQRLRPSTRSR